MDGTRFDAFTQALSSGTTRRGALGLLAVAGALALEAASARKRKRQRKHQNQQGNQDNSAGSVCAAAGARTCEPAHAKPGANLSRCDFAEGRLVSANLHGANASQANFTGAHMLGSNLSGANLGKSCFAGASLRQATLRGATVGGADFSGADLCAADLRGTNATAAQIASAGTLCCSTRRPNGKSAAPCRAGRTCCESICTDVKHDSGNCGACGNVCPRGQICCDGTCETPGQGDRCAQASPCLSPADDLQQALDAADSGATIYLCAGTWELADTLLINKDVSIYGPTSGGTILDAQGAVQVLGIRPDVNVIVGNVTFTNGAADEGAGIFNQGNLALYDCEVTHDSARLGAGIYNEGNLYIYQTTVSNNAVKKNSDPFTPEYDGGGIYNDEGTVILYEGTVIADNTANVEGQDLGYGGGLFNYYGDVTLKSTVQMTDNHAATHGGGLYNRFGQMTFKAGSSVTDNIAGKNGGGLYDEFDCCSVHLVTIANSSIITGNTPDNCAGDPDQTPNCIG